MFVIYEHPYCTHPQIANQKRLDRNNALKVLSTYLVNNLVCLEQLGPTLCDLGTHDTCRQQRWNIGIWSMLAEEIWQIVEGFVGGSTCKYMYAQFGLSQLNSKDNFVEYTLIVSTMWKVPCDIFQNVVSAI